MSLLKNGIGLATALTLVAGLAVQTVPASAQPAGDAGATRSTGNAQRDTLLKMQRQIGIDLNDTRLEDVLKYIAETTKVTFEPMWKGDRLDGLDKDQMISMSVKDMPAIMFLEKVMQQVQAETDEECSWQLTPLGVLQVGTKARLNKFKRIEIYDINDLLFVMPVYNNAPEIDLQQVLQQSGGGGGGGGGGSGQSPFKDNNQKNQGQEQQRTKEERARDIINLITTFVEPSQWTDNGGEGGTIRYYQGHIIVEGPDYMQRGVNGYPWWPQVRVSTGGKRYVSLNMDTSVSKLNDLRPVPVTGQAGGGGVRPPGGGG